MILAYDCIIETRSNMCFLMFYGTNYRIRIYKKSGLESRDPGIEERSGFQSRDSKSFGIDTTSLV
jgi:hypothetical protein